MISRAVGSAFVLKDTRFQTTESCLYILQIIILCFIINNLPSAIYLLLIVLASVE